MERLNKYLAHAGLGSRRHCDDLILAGRVKIDGAAVRELGTRVDPATQAVTVDGQPIQAERSVYWLVYKPVGYLCTNHDPDGRPRALDLVPHIGERVYTVGRLDEDSEGLLLLTNDGDLAFKLMHPRFGVRKTYLVQVAGKPTRDDMQKLLDGFWLSDGHVKAQRVKRLKSEGESTWLEIVLAEGKNREIRRMLAKLDHKVMRLKRVAIGPLKLDRLRKGKSRPLKHDEVELLRQSIERRPPSQKPVRPEPLGFDEKEKRPGRPKAARIPGERPQGPRPSGAKPAGARPKGPRPEGPRPKGPRPDGPRPEGRKPSDRRTPPAKNPRQRKGPPARRRPQP